MRSALVTSVIAFLWISGVPFAVANCPIPDSALEEALLYIPRHTSALVESGKPALPFYLRVENGIGYFSDVPPKTVLDERGVPSDWYNYSKDGQNWQTITLAEAEKIWGKPIDRFKTTGRLPSKFPAFVTFNAIGMFNDEKNIYHIDIQFRENDGAIRYRVRGIGICNPQWINAIKPAP